jgi:hypothetical protein
MPISFGGCAAADIGDRTLSDGDLNTHFWARLDDRVLRVGAGKLVQSGRLAIQMHERESPNLNPALRRFADDALAEVSLDLHIWTTPDPCRTGKGTIADLKVPPERPIRYLRITGAARGPGCHVYRMGIVFRDGPVVFRAYPDATNGWGPLRNCHRGG